MISVSEALQIIKREITTTSPEIIDLEQSVGRVLAQDIIADTDLPPFDRSQMDGFALRAEDSAKAPVKLKIIGESAAGKGFDGEVKTGEAVRIMTGARVPLGADSVQKVELTEADEDSIEILEATKNGQNIVARGREITNGTKVFKTGETITAQKIATLASFGYAKVKVFRRPCVTILATGSEIVGVAETPGKDQIRNSNSVMLRSFAAPFAETRVLPLVRDDLETLKNQIAGAVGLPVAEPKNDYSLHIRNTKFEFKRLRRGGKSESVVDEAENIKPTQILGKTQEEPQILILSGGVSVGDYDFTKPALRELGAEIFFERISLKPGKPTVCAKLGNTFVFGLPGNPVSVAVTFHLFARTAILQMQSAKKPRLRKGYAVAKEKIRGAVERDSLLPVSLSTNKKGKLIIEALRFSGSSNFIAYARADALVFIPQGKNIKKDAPAEIYFLD